MAESSWPGPNHNSRAVTDAEFEQLAEPTGSDGMIGTPSGTAPVYADDSGMVVKIRAEKHAMVRGRRWYSGSVDFTKTISANASGLTRVDLVVLRLTRSTWDITTVVKTGTPGSGAPSLTQDTGTTGTFEIPMATVTVPSGDSSIGSSQVTRAEYYLGEALIVCTSTTRPGHAPGRRIWETDTGKEYVSDGSSWSTGREDTGWVTVSAASGWTGAGGSIAVRRKDGAVYCVFNLIRNATAAAGVTTTMFTVPSGYRPNRQWYATADVIGNVVGRVEVSTGGVATFRDDEAMAVSARASGSMTWPA